MFFFTADEHYGHRNIIEYCKRPFQHVDEMDQALIDRHNEVVKSKDTVVHVGDFSMAHSRRRVENAYIKRLNGNHVFVRGSHDYWLDHDPIEIDTGPVRDIWEKKISLAGENYYIVACHYAMRAWPRSHYGAWQVYGHTHGKMPGVGKQMDVGVDTNNFYPYSLKQIIEIMRLQPEVITDSRKKTNKKYGG
jgi:calcineurin-like phosphoesterase family protein